MKTEFKSRQFPLRDRADILEILLKDRTTKKNIKWATDDYIQYGFDLNPETEIDIRWLTNGLRNIVQPRVKKELEIQKERTKEKAEVFTPTWIVEKQVNYVDQEFKDLNLEEYINKRWLEITCGEGPYICARYDSTTGEPLQLDKRAGFLDKKLSRISNEIQKKEDWLHYVYKAYQSTYGYEYHGDSLLIARENLLFTFIDYYLNKFNEIPEDKIIKDIANIISYNIIQMDGLNYTIPYSSKLKTIMQDVQLDLFATLEESEEQAVENIQVDTNAKLKLWNLNKSIEFKQLELEGKDNMKFDVVIGNPPYQESDGSGGQGSSAMPIYQKFVEEAMKINPKYITMIVPSRWFTGGKGLNDFREMMLKSNRITRIVDFPNSNDCFPNVSIKGGVNFFVWDRDFRGDSIITTNMNGESDTLSRPLLEEGIDTFIRYNQSVKIVRKVLSDNPKSFSSIVSPRMPFGIPSTFKNITREKNKNSDVIIYGNNIKGYVDLKYIKRNNRFIDKYKVFISFAYGAGDNFPHQIINKPFIGERGSCSTETYLVIGPFDYEEEAENCISYIKTKLFRFMVLQKKISQNATSGVYELVPLLDFSRPWTDEELYKKYNITKKEQEYIDSMIRPMDLEL